jgi:hypothetical protein
MPSPMDSPTDPAVAWSLVLRVAVASSLLMAALGAALARFTGIGPAPILLGAVVLGSALGVSLPPARPAALRRRAPI